MAHLSQRTDHTWLLSKVHALFIFSWFLTKFPFSVPGYHITFSLHDSRGSSWLRQFLKLALFLITLAVWKSTGRAFCRMAFNWDLFGSFFFFFHDWTEGMSFGEEEH